MRHTLPISSKCSKPVAENLMLAEFFAFLYNYSQGVVTVLIGSVSTSIHTYSSSLVDHSLVFIYIVSSDWSCLMLLIGSATPPSFIEALSV